MRNTSHAVAAATAMIPSWLGEKTPAEVLADLRDGYVDVDEAREYFRRVAILDQVLGGGR